MEERISLQQFELRQPDFKREESHEKFFLHLSNRLLNEVIEGKLLPRWPEEVVARAAMGVVGYYQDILADAGLWRSFITMHRHLYGKHLPFYKVNDDYVDFELNFEDVQFLTWYSLCLNYDEMRTLSPMDADIERTARRWFDILEEEYEEAPVPESYKMGRGLEMNVPEEAEQIYNFGHWLFIYSYLMSPAYSMTLLNIMNEPEMQNADGMKIAERLEQSMMQDPTGPLALYLREWLFMILENKYPIQEEKEEERSNADLHPHYKSLTEFSDGSPIVYIEGYENLNRFFIDAMGWSADEEHLPQMKSAHDFILLADPEKGMLLAKDIARCVKDSANPMYDEEYAKGHAMELLTVRGKCPADLLHYLHNHNLLPDAHFEGDEDTAIVKDNFDFIARCYLQLYYRGD